MPTRWPLYLMKFDWLILSQFHALQSFTKYSQNIIILLDSHKMKAHKEIFRLRVFSAVHAYCECDIQLRQDKFAMNNSGQLTCAQLLRNFYCKNSHVTSTIASHRIVSQSQEVWTGLYFKSTLKGRTIFFHI